MRPLTRIVVSDADHGGDPPEEARPVPAGFGEHLSLRNFNRLADFIQNSAGIRLPLAKKSMVEGRLHRRLKALGLASGDEYCALLFGGGLEGEASHLIDVITTNKTDFFREPEHFRLLVARVLPDLLEQPVRIGIGRPLKVWSAACSTGAEPYTLAMVLDDFARGRRGFRFEIVGTDICTGALDKARMAVYPAEMIDPVPPDWRKRYVLRTRDPSDASVRMAPFVREMVRFGQLNLMEESYPLDVMDVIFVRNILIYFDRETQRRVLIRICDRLRAGGYLFVGHSETVAGNGLPLESVAAALYRRV